MTRLATQCLKSAAVVAFALSMGAAAWAQAKPAKKSKPHRSRSAAALKTARKPAAKTAAKPLAKEAAPSSPTAVSAPAGAPAGNDGSLDLVGKRDPFVALVNSSKGPTEHLPPGKAGLVIGTLTVQGTVQGANGMIAVIANPDQRVYFVRQGDRLYDGEVEKISLDAVTFQQNTKDAFGKPIERTVVKRIYPSAGEQQ
jgi:Pilus assembly protein, PilP